MPIQIRRTATPNNPPTGLLPGQLSVEMASEPARLWVGVPPTIDPSQRREVGVTKEYVDEAVAAGAPAAASLLSAQVNVRGNRVNINTMNFSVQQLVVRDAAGNGRLVAGTAGQQCNVNNQGANGRDQAAAFGNNVWIHFYWIYDPDTDTLATLASLIAPPAGPAFPAGFTHWCYIGPVRKTTAADGLMRVRFVGSSFYYAEAHSATMVVNAGGTGTRTLVSVATWVPQNAYDWQCGFIIYTGSGSSSGGIDVESGVTGANYYGHTWAYTADYGSGDNHFTIPNNNQSLWYHLASGSGALSIWVMGYRIPNGAV